MRQFANVWQVYEISGSSLQLGLTGLFQALPLFTIGLFAGTVSDVVDRRKLLMATQVVNLVLAAAFAALTASGGVEVWHIYVLTALTSSVNVFQQPARVTLISATVPESHLMTGIGLNQAIQQSAMLAGPSIAGLVVAAAGPAAAYLINGVLFVPALIALGMMRTARTGIGEGRRFSLAAVGEGLRFVWGAPVLVGLILLDTVATLFGSYRSLMPVFAKDILAVDASGLGIMFSAPAFGALAGTLGILGLGNVRRKGYLVLSATLLYGAGLAVFGLSQWFILTLVTAALLGFFDSMGVSARQTTVQLLAPDRLRGRATSVQQIFAMGAPSMGYVVAGSMASVTGAPGAMVLGSVIVCAVVVLVAVINRQLREYRA
jgi:MFS family permease